MSLRSLLTTTTLRNLAGPSSFFRGQEYFRMGRARSLALDGDALTGVVEGTATYQVSIAAAGRGLRWSCTCPMDTFCKHVVALALTYAERAEHAVPESEPAEVGLGSREQVRAWAHERQLDHVLASGGELLAPYLPEVMRAELRYLLGRGSVLDLTEPSQLAAMPARLVQALQRAARSALADEEARLAVACREEAARERASAAELSPQARELGTLLGAMRRAVRARAAPRTRAWRAEQSWSFALGEATVTWKERVRCDVWTLGLVPVVATLTVTDREARSACACGAQEGCVHTLALLDTTLEFLADPARRDAAEAMAAELLRPSWARALSELVLPAAAPAKPRPAIELWWRMERELGVFTLSAMVKKSTRSGGWSAGSHLSTARLLDEYRDVLEPADLAIAEALMMWDPKARGAPSYPVRAFAAAVGHPRLISELGGGERTEAPVALARVSLGFSALPAADSIRLEPSLEGVRFPPRLLVTLLELFSRQEPLLTHDPTCDRVVLIDVSDEVRRLWAVLQKHGDSFPPESHAQLLERLAEWEGRVPLQIPRQLLGTQLNAAATTVVRLRLLPTAALELELFVRPGPGAPMYPPGVGPRDVLLVRHGERGYLRRDLGTEGERARAALAALPIDLTTAEEGPPGCFRVTELDDALTLVAALERPPPGIEADWISERPTFGGEIQARQLRVTVEHRRDWFDLTGEAKVETGRLELAVLLDAARRQQRWVQIGERRWAKLGDELRKRLGAVADRTFTGKQRLELSPAAVPAIRELAEAGARVDTAAPWHQLTERLERATRLRPRPPAALQATLRDYQVEGHAWLARVAAWGAGACLADDMGLGKTVQAIALLLDRASQGPALVLAPTSVCWNWGEELARFAPTLRPVFYGEAADRDACLTKLGKKDVLILSYGLLVRDADKLAARRFGTLVLDEAQALKNATTHRAKAARRLQADFRVALSGTPLENHLGELWSLFAVVFPGLLGSWDHFRDNFASPIERTQHAEARAALSRLLRPFLLRRTKQEVARELPPRTEVQVPVALSAQEHALYEDARLAAVAELSRQGKEVRDEQHRFQVLAALTRLRLLASHPRLYDPTSTIPSSKLHRLIELLTELRSEGHRALVFSQFTSHLALVREQLDNAGISTLYLDGATPTGQRKARIQAFQDGQGDAFLISLKAGGTGLNLTAADYVIHLDPWWNPAVEDQASDRAHRIGQTKPVTVYRLISRGTIEEKILTMHADKRALVANVLDGTNVAGRLSTRDLMELIRGAPPEPSPDEGSDENDNENDNESGKDRGSKTPKRPRPKLTLVR